MPLNNIICSTCGTRINYVVNPDASTQEVICNQCKSVNTVRLSSLPERVQESLAEYKKDSIAFEEDISSVNSLDGDDEEDKALNYATKSFQDAKNMFAGLWGEAAMETDIQSFADEYIPADDDELNLSNLGNHIDTRTNQHQNDSSRYENRPSLNLEDDYRQSSNEDLNIDRLTQDEINELLTLGRKAIKMGNKLGLANSRDILNHSDAILKLARKIGVSGNVVNKLDRLIDSGTIQRLLDMYGE